MIRDKGAHETELRRRARECFGKMLLDYDNVQILTIDSFLQTLLNGLASILQMNVGYKTELDIQHVIRCAVDDLLTTDMTDKDKEILSGYMQVKLDEEGDWNVKKSLCDLAEEMYNESVQLLEAADKIHFDQTIVQMREAIRRSWEQNEKVAQINRLLFVVDSADLRATNGGAVTAAANNIRQSLSNPKKLKSENRFRGLTDNQLENARKGDWKKLPADAVQAIIQATELVRDCKADYYTMYLSVALSHDMELMASLQRIIQRNLNEANCALLSKTASTLTQALQKGDADFILEKAGIRYKHVLMDEFQDTSQLQWKVIKQLLQDVLAGAGNTLLIVGDIKQSIYRWRNGDWHIMDELTENTDEITPQAGQINEKFTSLARNFRSSAEVVRFNLSLFNHITEHYEQAVENADETEKTLVQRIYNEGFDENHLADFYRSNDKQGGYVCFKAFPSESEEGEKIDVKEAAMKHMFDTMESLLAQGMSPADIMVLVRKGYHAADITSSHSVLDPADYPNLSKVSFVSATSYLLEASQAVQTIIHALKIVVNEKDDIAAQYLHMVSSMPDIIGQIRRRVNPRMPLYEAVNELINLLLADENGQYPGTETAYVNNLLDRTREFVGSYGSHIQTFLDYWDDTLHEKSIPASPVGAIRIMTIHKSKGLQAQTLFVPFCDWLIDESKDSQKIWCRVAPELYDKEEYVPVPFQNEMAITAYQREYEEEHLNQRIDSLNMLYVALTRAEDNLYIYSNYDVHGEPIPKRHVGRYLMNFSESDDIEFGTPVIKQHQKVSNDLKPSNSQTLKPFSFSHVPVSQAQVWANSEQVHFVQSQEGALYTEYGEEAYRRVAKMDEGTLCHEIFANLHKADELDAVLDRFETQGQIKDKAQRENLKALISSAWEGNAQMKDWFTAPWELRLEEAIYHDRELRPDRVMINPNTNEAIVLDYKFGHWENEYLKQVKNYMEALRKIGYNPVRGFLWFARKENGDKLIEVHEK
jgi:ATP-dependent exoDNAse (exonuclease V) beta subunit